MTRLRFLVPLFLVSYAFVAFGDNWQNVAPGVDYQEIRENDYDIYVTRIDLTNDRIRIVVSREDEKGLKVSDYAKKTHAVAAINGDYFDEQFTPVGLAIGACGKWATAKDAPHEKVVEVSHNLAVIRNRSDLPTPPPSDGIDAAISGWPFVVNGCRALTAPELPGSDAFTRTAHPRTAVGISADGHTMYFVVADGRRTGVPGLTLAQLGSFLADRLKVCSAINFDGGGSSAMWVGDRIVNRPSDGVERPVGDAIAVILRKDFTGCEAPPQTNTAASPQ
jgi:exopolysaccharide biosynthesis protein